LLRFFFPFGKKEFSCPRFKLRPYWSVLATRKEVNDVLPFINSSDVLAFHEERIRASQRPVPEWIGIALPPQRRPESEGVRQQVRSLCARVLRRLAASVDPQGSVVNA
jgi:hypothetical protein